MKRFPYASVSPRLLAACFFGFCNLGFSANSERSEGRFLPSRRVQGVQTVVARTGNPFEIHQFPSLIPTRDILLPPGISIISSDRLQANPPTRGFDETLKFPPLLYSTSIDGYGRGQRVSRTTGSLRAGGRTGTVAPYSTTYRFPSIRANLPDLPGRLSQAALARLFDDAHPRPETARIPSVAAFPVCRTGARTIIPLRFPTIPYPGRFSAKAILSATLLTESGISRADAHIETTPPLSSFAGDAVLLLLLLSTLRQLKRVAANPSLIRGRNRLFLRAYTPVLWRLRSMLSGAFYGVAFGFFLHWHEASWLSIHLPVAGILGAWIGFSLSKVDHPAIYLLIARNWLKSVAGAVIGAGLGYLYSIAVWRGLENFWFMMRDALGILNSFPGLSEASLIQWSAGLTAVLGGLNSIFPKGRLLLNAVETLCLIGLVLAFLGFLLLPFRQ